MNDITYILGAGASSKAMPLVSNFAERFDIFYEYIELKGNISSNLKRNMLEFKNSIHSHYSFDTFFKKLFHQKAKEKEILKYKVVLLIFFLFEHLIEIKHLESNNLFRKQMAEKKQKEFNLDPRYEALIAGLLKPLKGKTEFYKNVNFITWNYDVNLLYALKNYINPDSTLTSFINDSKREKFFEINEQVKVIHMNGYIYHSILDQFNQPDSMRNYINLLSAYASDNLLEEVAGNIHFAWEDENRSNYFQAIVNNSNQIVLIGYSLPLYNRLVDLVLLHQNVIKRKSLYIQNLDTGDSSNIRI